MDINSKVTIDSNDNIIIMITTHSSIITDEFSECSLSISSNIIVTKWSQIRELIWTSAICGDGMDNGMDLSIDTNDNILITGYSTSAILLNKYFFPKTDTTNDVLVTKLNKYGNIEWLQIFPGSSDDFSRAITSDRNNDIYITGITDSEDLMQFQNLNVTLNGEQDVFVSKLNLNGEIEWIKVIGGNLTDHAWIILYIH